MRRRTFLKLPALLLPTAAGVDTTVLQVAAPVQLPVTDCESDAAHIIRLVGIDSYGRHALDMLARTIEELDSVDCVPGGLLYPDRKVRLEFASLTVNHDGPFRPSSGSQLTRDRHFLHPAVVDSVVTMGGDIDSTEPVRRITQGADMVIPVTRLGSGSATWLTPLVAEVAREQGGLTMVLAAVPASSECEDLIMAEDAYLAAVARADCVHVIREDDLAAGPHAFIGAIQSDTKINAILYPIVSGIAGALSQHMIGTDFADFREIIVTGGVTLVCTGTAVGPNRVRRAVEAALSNLPPVQPSDAHTLWANVVADESFTIDDFYEVMELLEPYGADQCMLTTCWDSKMGDNLRFTMMVTGLPR